MWWKRKETDIFPEFGAEKLVKMISFLAIIAYLCFVSLIIQQSLRYSSVKYQFEVMPRRNLLQKEGFMPPEEEEKIDISKPNESSEV
jgi:hypothetical protein